MISTLHHTSLYHASRMSELGKLNWSSTFRHLGLGMVLVFVPIYLTQLGFSLSAIFGYFTQIGVFWVLLIYPAYKATAVVGTNRMMAIGSFFALVYVATLLTLGQYGWPLWLLALSFASMVTPYWFALRVNFSKAVDHRKAGKQLGLTSALALAALGIAPALGGIIAETLNPSALYVVAFSIVLLSVLPLLVGSQPTMSERPDLRRLRWRKVSADLVANGSLQIDDVLQSAVWPLLIFLVIPSYAGVGILSSVMVVAAIATSLYVGRKEANRGERHFIREGSTLISLINGLRVLASNTTHIAGINFMSGISHALLDTPYNTRYYRNADAENRFEYVFAMQLASALGWLLYAAILLGLSLIIPSRTTVLTLGLVLAIPFSLLIPKIR